eukprot:scaffold2058_cov115-Cylindrotheca_fusiformis.AAC.11
MRDFAIEWDFNHEDFVKALDEGRPLHSLCITEEFLNPNTKNGNNNNNNTKLTVPKLEAIFSKISEMWTLEGIHLALEKKEGNTTTINAIPEKCLPLAMNPGLQILKVHSGLEIQSRHGCELFATALKQNGLSLKQISLLNIKIKLNAFASLGQWGKRSLSRGSVTSSSMTTAGGGGGGALLDPILKVIPELQLLEIFELTCHESQQNNPTKPSHVSVEAVRTLCGSSMKMEASSLIRLNLSNLGMHDEHFMAIAQELSKNKKSNKDDNDNDDEPSTTTSLQELILNSNFNTELGVEMVIRMLIDSPTTSLRTFHAYQTETPLSPACVDLLLFVLARNNTTLTDISIHTTFTKEQDRLELYQQLNQAGRYHFINNNKSMTADEWISVLESVNDNPSMMYYCLRQSKFWWNWMSIGNSTTTLPNGRRRPILKTKQRPLFDTNNNLQSNSNNNNNNNNNAIKAVEENGDLSERFQHQLEILGLPEMLQLENDEDENEVLSSHRSDSYLDDLYRQKDTLVDDTREEALEQAHEIYERRFGNGNNNNKNKNTNEAAFLEIFYQVLSEREKLTEAQYRYQDELIQKETDRIKKQNQIEKEEWMKERDAMKRRKQDMEHENKEEQQRRRKSNKLATSLDQRKTSSSQSKARLEELQSEAEDMRERWKVARQKTRAASSRDKELNAKLKEQEEIAFAKWVEKRQAVKEAEAKVIQDTEQSLQMRKSYEESDAQTGGSVENVWDVWAKLEEEVQQIV